MPPVAERECFRSIWVDQGAGICSEFFTLGNGTGHEDATRWWDINIDLGAAHALMHAMYIGIVCLDGDVEAFVTMRQFVVVAVDADLRLASIPLVADLAQAICIFQGVRCGEGFILSSSTGNGDGTGR